MLNVAVINKNRTNSSADEKSTCSCTSEYKEFPSVLRRDLSALDKKIAFSL